MRDAVGGLLYLLDMATYIPTAQTVPTDECPDNSWQAMMNFIATYLRITIPDNTGVVIQASTPSTADQSKLWIKTDTAPPYIIGAFVYSGGDWRRIPGLPMYFVDTSASANTITITTGESIANTAFIVGRLWIIKVANSVTGATTLAIDSLTPKGLKKANDEDLASGDIESGQVILVAYDSAADNYEVLTTLGISVITAISTTKSLPAEGSNITYAHGYGVVPEFVSVKMQCISAEHGYTENDEADLDSFFVIVDFGSDELTQPAFVVTSDSTNITISRGTGDWPGQTGTRMRPKATGAVETSPSMTYAMDPAKWQFIIRVKKNV